jgi:hypothetical protein
MPDVGTRSLVLEVDSIDFTDSVKKAVIRSAETDSDFMSFADAANGGARDYSLALTLKQNTSTDSLHDYIWSHAGEDVTVVFWPNGDNGGTASASFPKYTGTVTIVDPDGDLLGGEAKASNTAKMTTEVEWKFLAKPVKATS